jgi:hypothetical protein
MEKVKFGKEECKNLIAMINSPDESNSNLAHTIIDSLDINDNLFWIFMVFIFSGKDETYWEKNKFYDALNLELGFNFSLCFKDKQKVLNVIEYFIVCPDHTECITFYFEMYVEVVKTKLEKFGFEFEGNLKIVKK